MPDESVAVPRNPARIDLSAADEARYWARTLGASETVLRDAVARAGDEVEKVREYLSSGN